MWIKSENSESTKPAALEPTVNGMIVRRNFREVAAIEDMPAHWTYEEWQMTKGQYDVYQAMSAENEDLSDALIELAEMIVGGE